MSLLLGYAKYESASGLSPSGLNIGLGSRGVFPFETDGACIRARALRSAWLAEMRRSRCLSSACEPSSVRAGESGSIRGNGSFISVTARNGDLEARSPHDPEDVVTFVPRDLLGERLSLLCRNLERCSLGRLLLEELLDSGDDGGVCTFMQCALRTEVKKDAISACESSIASIAQREQTELLCDKEISTRGSQRDET